jgi:micrococcal nuclease
MWSGSAAILSRVALSALVVLTRVVGSLTAHAQDRIPATVISVLDGDTIKMHDDVGASLNVRLIGIDTPATKHQSKPVQCYGMVASAKTAELLPVGTRVELEMDVQDRDRYGRTLAYVWREGGMLMVNEQLVAEGYALTLTIPLNVRYSESFASAARIARENGLGLWSVCTGGPLDATDDAPIAEDATPADSMTSSEPASSPASKPETKPAGNCHPSYLDFCIPPAPPDLNCTSPLIAGRRNFAVRQPDLHRFDSDRDGVRCESSR